MHLLITPPGEYQFLIPIMRIGALDGMEKMNEEMRKEMRENGKSEFISTLI